MLTQYLQVSITGFNAVSTGGDNLGAAVSVSGGMSYVGAPSADNSGFRSTAPPGRLYVKSWCDPHYGALYPSNGGLSRYCYACPAGTDNTNGNALFGSIGSLCSVCGTAGAGGAFLPGYGCAWTCAQGLFGPSCSSCSAFMAGSTSARAVNVTLPGQSLAAVAQAAVQTAAGLPLTGDAAGVMTVAVVQQLAANAVWVDAPAVYPADLTVSRLCVWTCITGFTVNASAVVVLPASRTSASPASVTYVLGLRPGLSEAAGTACIPPPPPPPIAGLAVIGLPTQQCGASVSGARPALQPLACYNDSAPMAISSSSVTAALFLPNATTMAAAVSQLRAALLFNQRSNTSAAFARSYGLAPYWALANGSAAGLSPAQPAPTPPTPVELLFGAAPVPVFLFDSDGDYFSDELSGAAWPVPVAVGAPLPANPSAALGCLAFPLSACAWMSPSTAAWGQWKRAGWGDGPSSFLVTQALRNTTAATLDLSLPLDAQLWTPASAAPLGTAPCRSIFSAAFCAGADSLITVDAVLPSAAVISPPSDALGRAQAAVAASAGVSLQAVTAAGSPYSSTGACSGAWAPPGTQVLVASPGACQVPATLRLTGLQSGFAYRMVVAAGNVGGWGQYSPLAPQQLDSGVSSFSLLPPVPPTAPGAPSSAPLQLPVSSGGLLNVTWSAPAGFGGGPQLGFELCLVSPGGADAAAAAANLFSALTSQSPSAASLGALCTVVAFRGRGSPFALSQYVPLPAATFVYRWPGTPPTSATAAFLAGWPTAASPTLTFSPSLPTICNGYGLGYRFGWSAVVSAFLNATSIAAAAGIAVNASLVNACLIRAWQGTVKGALELSPEGWDANVGSGNGVLLTGLPAGSTWVASARVFTSGGASNFSGASVLVASPASPPSAISPTWWVAQNSSSGSGSAPQQLAWGIACDGATGGRAQLRWGRPSLTGGSPLSYRVWFLIDPAGGGAANASALLGAMDPAAASADAGDLVQVLLWGSDGSVLLDSDASAVGNATLQVAMRFDVSAPSPGTAPALLSHAPTSLAAFGLFAGTTYRVRIAALNVVGAGPVSDAAGLPLGVCVTGPATPPTLSPRILAPPLPEVASSLPISFASMGSRSCAIGGNASSASNDAALVWDPTGMSAVPNGTWSTVASAFSSDASVSGSSSGPGVVALSPSTVRVKFWPPADCGGADQVTFRVDVSLAAPAVASLGLPGIGALPTAGLAGSPGLAAAAAAGLLGLGPFSDAVLSSTASVPPSAVATLRGSFVDLRAAVRAVYELSPTPIVPGRKATPQTFVISGLPAGSTVCVRLAAVTNAGVSPWSSFGRGNADRGLDASLPVTAWAGTYAGLAAAWGVDAIDSLNCTWRSGTLAGSGCAASALLPSAGAFSCAGPSTLGAPAAAAGLSLQNISSAVSAALDTVGPRTCVMTPQQPVVPPAAPSPSAIPASSVVFTPTAFSGLELAAFVAGLAPARVTAWGVSTAGGMGLAVSGYDDGVQTSPPDNTPSSDAVASMWQSLCNPSTLSSPWPSAALPNGSALVPLWLQPCVNLWTAGLLARLYRDFGATAVDLDTAANAMGTASSASSGLAPQALSAVLTPTSAGLLPAFASGSLVRLLCDGPIDSGGAPLLGFVVEALLLTTGGMTIYGSSWTAVPVVLPLSGSALSGDGSAAIWRTFVSSSNATLGGLSVVASATYGNGTDVVLDSALNVTTASFSLSSSTGWGPMRHDALMAALSATPLASTLAALPSWANASSQGGRGAPVRWLLPPAVAKSQAAPPRASAGFDYSRGFGSNGEPSTVLLLGGLIANSTYRVRVAAVTVAGAGPMSPAVDVQTQAWSAPGSPGTPRLYYGFARAAAAAAGQSVVQFSVVSSAGPVRSSSVDLSWAGPLETGGTPHADLSFKVYAFVQRADVSAARSVVGPAPAACDLACASGSLASSPACAFAPSLPPTDGLTGRAIMSSSNGTTWILVGTTSPGVTALRVAGLRASTTYAFAVVSVGRRPEPDGSYSAVLGATSRPLLNITTAPVSPPDAPQLLVGVGSTTALQTAVSASALSESRISVVFSPPPSDGGAPIAGYRVFLAAAPSNATVAYVGGPGVPGMSWGINASVDAAAALSLAPLIAAGSSYPAVSAALLSWISVADVLINSTFVSPSSGCSTGVAPGASQAAALPLWNASSSVAPSLAETAATLIPLVLTLHPQEASAFQGPPLAALQSSPGTFVVSPPPSASVAQRISVTIGSLSAATTYIVRVAAWSSAPGVLTGSSNARAAGNASVGAWMGPASALVCLPSASNSGIAASVLCPSVTTSSARIPSQPPAPIISPNSSVGSASLDLLLSPPTDLGGAPLVAFRVALTTDQSLPGVSTAAFVVGGAAATAATAACRTKTVSPGSNRALQLSLPGHSPWAQLPPLVGLVDSGSSAIGDLCTALSPAGSASGPASIGVRLFGLHANETYFAAVTAVSQCGWSHPSALAGPFVTRTPALATASSPSYLSALPQSDSVPASALMLPLSTLNASSFGPCGTAQGTDCTPPALADAVDSAYSAVLGTSGSDFITLSWAAPVDAGLAPVAGYLVGWLRVPGTNSSSTVAWDAICAGFNSSNAAFIRDAYPACGGLVFVPLDAPALLLAYTNLSVAPPIADPSAAAAGIAAVEIPATAAPASVLPPAAYVYRLASLAAGSSYAITVRAVSEAGAGDTASIFAQTSSTVRSPPAPVPPPSVLLSLVNSPLLRSASAAIAASSPSWLPFSVDALVGLAAPDTVVLQWSAAQATGGGFLSAFVLDFAVFILGASAPSPWCTNASNGVAFAVVQAPWCFSPTSLWVYIRATVPLSNASCGAAATASAAASARYVTGLPSAALDCSMSHRYAFALTSLDVAGAALSGSSAAQPYALSTSNSAGVVAAVPLPPSALKINISSVNDVGVRSVATAVLSNLATANGSLRAATVYPSSLTAASLLSWPRSALPNSSDCQRTALFSTPQLPPWQLVPPDCALFNCTSNIGVASVGAALGIPAPLSSRVYASSGAPLAPWVSPVSCAASTLSSVLSWLGGVSPGVLALNASASVARPIDAASLSQPVSVFPVSSSVLAIAWRFPCPQLNKSTGICDASRTSALSFVVSVRRTFRALSAPSCCAGGSASAAACSCSTLLPLVPVERLVSTGLAGAAAVGLTLSNATAYGIVLQGLSAGASYSVVVAAVYSAGGVGPWSPPTDVTLPLSLSTSIAPQALAAAVGSGFVDVSARMATGAAGTAPTVAGGMLLHLALVVGMYVLPPTLPVSLFRSNASAILSATPVGERALLNYSLQPVTASLAAQRALSAAASGGAQDGSLWAAYLPSTAGGKPLAAAPQWRLSETSWRASASLPQSVSTSLDPASIAVSGTVANMTLWAAASLGPAYDDAAALSVAGHAGCFESFAGLSLSVAPSLQLLSTGAAQVVLKSSAAASAVALSVSSNLSAVYAAGLSQGTPALRRLFGLPSDAVVALSVGRLDLSINASASFGLLFALAAASNASLSLGLAPSMWLGGTGSASLGATATSLAVQIPPAAAPSFPSALLAGGPPLVSGSPAVLALTSSSVVVRWSPPLDAGGRATVAYVVQVAPVALQCGALGGCSASADPSGLVSSVVTGADWGALTNGSASALVAALPPLTPPCVAALGPLSAGTQYAMRVAAFSGLSDALFALNASAAAVAADASSRAALASFSSPITAAPLLVAEQQASVACNTSWWSTVAPAGLGPFSDWSAPFWTNPPGPPLPPSPPQLLRAVSTSGAAGAPLGSVTSSSVSLTWPALPAASLSGAPLLFYRLHIRTADGSPALPAVAATPPSTVVCTHNALPLATVLAATGGASSLQGVGEPTSASAAAVSVVSGCATAITVTGLAAATPYQFAVSAVNTAGDSGPSVWSPVIVTAPASLAVTVAPPGGSGALVAAGIAALLGGVGPASGGLILLPLAGLSGGAPLTHFVVSVTAAGSSNASALLVLSAADAIAAGDIVVAAHVSLGVPLPATITAAVRGAQALLVNGTAGGGVALPVLAAGGPRYAAFLLRGLLAGTSYSVRVDAANPSGLSTAAAVAAAASAALCNVTVDAALLGGAVRAMPDVCVGPGSAAAAGAAQWPTVSWRVAGPSNSSSSGGWTLGFTTVSTALPPSSPLPPLWLPGGGASGGAPAPTLDLAILRPTDLGGAPAVAGYALQLSGDGGATWGGDRVLPAATQAQVAQAASPSAVQTGVRGTPLRHVGVALNSSSSAPVVLPWPAAYAPVAPGSLAGGADALAIASGAAAVYGVSVASFMTLVNTSNASAAAAEGLGGSGLLWLLSPQVAGTLSVTPTLLSQWYAGAVLLSLKPLSPVPLPGVPLLSSPSLSSTPWAVDTAAVLAAAGASLGPDADLFAAAAAGPSAGGALSGVGAGDGDACGLASALFLIARSSPLPSWLPFGALPGALPSLADPASPCVHATARLTGLYGAGSTYLVRAAALSTAVGNGSASAAGAPGSPAAAASWAAAQVALAVPAAASPLTLALPPLASNDTCAVAAAAAALTGASSIRAALILPPAGSVSSGDIPADRAGGALPAIAQSDALAALLQVPVASRLGFGSYSAASAVAASTPAAISPSGPVQALAVDLLSPSLLRVSWLPPLSLGGGAPLCYRVEVALDGALGDACDVAVTAGGAFDPSAGFVTALSPPPLNSSGLPLFQAASAPAIGAWQRVAWGALLSNQSNATLAAAASWALAALDPAGSGSVPARADDGSVVPLPLAQFLSLTSQTLAGIGVAGPADPYAALRLPFGPGFNSSARLSSSAAAAAALPASATRVATGGSWVSQLCVGAPVLPPVPRWQLQAGATPVPFIPVAGSLDAARVSASLPVLPGALVRVRVAAVTAAVAPAPSLTAAPTTTLAAALGASPAGSSGTSRRRLAQQDSDDGGAWQSSTPAPAAARRAQATPATRSASASPSRSLSRTPSPSPSMTPSPSVSPAAWVPWAPAPGAALLAPWAAGATDAAAAAPALLLVVPAAPPPPPPSAPLLAYPLPNATAATVQLPPALGRRWSGGCHPTRAALFRAASLPDGSAAVGPETLVWSSDDNAAYPLATRSAATAALLLPALQQGAVVVDTGLFRATPYRYRCVVGNAIGWSLPSPPLLVTTAVAPASAPLALAVLSSQLLPVVVPLSWQAPADNGGAAIAGYYVQVRCSRLAITPHARPHCMLSLPCVPLPCIPSQYAAVGRSLPFAAAEAALANGSLPWLATIYAPLASLAVVQPVNGSARYAFNVSGLSPSSRYLLRVAALTPPPAGFGAWSPLVNATTPDPLPCPGLPDPGSPGAVNGSAPNSGRGRCSGHGQCGPWDGSCACDAGYAPPSCAFTAGLALSATLAVDPGEFSAAAFAAAVALVVNASVGPGTAVPVPAGVTVPFGPARVLVVRVTPAASATAARRVALAGGTSAGAVASSGVSSAAFKGPPSDAATAACAAALAQAVSAAEWPADLLPVPVALDRGYGARFSFDAAGGDAASVSGGAAAALDAPARRACFAQYALAVASEAAAAAPSRKPGTATTLLTLSSGVRRAAVSSSAGALVVEFMLVLTAAEQAARAAAVATAGGIVAFAAAAAPSSDPFAVAPPPLTAVPLDPELPSAVALAALQAAAAAQSSLLTGAGMSALQVLSSPQARGTAALRLSPPPSSPPARLPPLACRARYWRRRRRPSPSPPCPSAPARRHAPRASRRPPAAGAPRPPRVASVSRRSSRTQRARLPRAPEPRTARRCSGAPQARPWTSTSTRSRRCRRARRAPPSAPPCLTARPARTAPTAGGARQSRRACVPPTWRAAPPAATRAARGSTTTRSAPPCAVAPSWT